VLILTIIQLGLRIKKVTWDDFKGEIDSTSNFKAYTFWYISYNYTINKNKIKTNLVIPDMQITVQIKN
jgi:hypothetical protein